MGTYDTIGGTPRHDPAFDWDAPCLVCGGDPAGGPSGCDCPECLVCGVTGNPECFEKHGLKHEEEE